MRKLELTFSLCLTASLAVACHSPTDALPRAVALVRLPTASFVLARGEDRQLDVLVLGGDGGVIYGAPVHWSSEAPGIASVSETGVVHGSSRGSTTIAAKSGNATAYVAVAVADPFADVPEQLVMQAPPPEIWTAEAVTLLKPFVLNKWFEAIPAAVVTWSSSRPSLATVSPEGVVRGVSPGTVTITASSGSAAASATIEVVPLEGLRIEGPTRLVPGSDGTMKLIGVSHTARVVDRPPPEQAWSTSDSSVATVSAYGIVTAGHEGTATLTANSGQFTASMQVTSRALPGTLAYVAAAGTGKRVMLIKLDGTPATEFTPAAGVAGESAAISPDGRRVAFDCNLIQVCVADIGATAPTFLRATRIDGPGWPSWSSDARTLVVQRSISTFSVIADTSDWVLSVYDDVRRPRLSPDGAYIQFECSGESYDMFDELCWMSSIRGAQSFGTQVRNASRGAWSPFGQITFDSRAGVCVGDPNPSTPCRLLWADQYHLSTESAWSPDAAHIVMARGGELFVVDSNGENLVRLPKAAAANARVSDPSWGAPRP